MNILIIGSGGREHALGWKLQQSANCGDLHFAPGNAGTASLGENHPIKVEPVTTKTIDEVDYLCRKRDIQMIVIGPEDPLAQGLADRLAKPGRIIFGPSAAAARLEADKAFCKQLLRSASIPTAEARTFTAAGPAINYCEAHETPLVVKAAGLAKGKGVVVCDDAQQAVNAVRQIMIERVHDQAGDTVVIEERLTGQEVSILALVDGSNLYILETAQDHKQLGEGDIGPNTGGMGAYSPTPLVDDMLSRQIQSQILVPTVDALRREGVTYQGVLYAGLMLTAGGPKVLEYNCRFGDPEIQALLLRLQGDLIDIMTATAQGQLDQVDLAWNPRPSCCVVMASGGYPGAYPKGLPIKGLDEAAALPDVQIFHAGTARKGEQIVTNGGRVLNICATGDTLQQARDKANQACELIRFEGAQYRRDIGDRVMKGKN